MATDRPCMFPGPARTRELSRGRVGVGGTNSGAGAALSGRDAPPASPISTVATSATTPDGLTTECFCEVIIEPSPAYPPPRTHARGIADGLPNRLILSRRLNP